MAEASLTGALIAVLLFALWLQRSHEKERDVWMSERTTLLNKIIARTPMEAKALDAPFTPPKVEREYPDGYEHPVGL